MTELIAKIAVQTGQPPEPSVLAHLGDVPPPSQAHQLTVILGVHQEDGALGEGGLLGAPGQLRGSWTTSVSGFAGAIALASVAQSLRSSYLAEER